MDIIIIIEQFWAQTWIEWTILVTSIFYIVLAARENIWCWFFGIISC
ncbi:MAG: nicotinamide mononucleotide transporter, partial [Saprospiraceae bacterium]